jgi:hypothetical protein
VDWAAVDWAVVDWALAAHPCRSLTVSLRRTFFAAAASVGLR